MLTIRQITYPPDSNVTEEQLFQARSVRVREIEVNATDNENPGVQRIRTVECEAASGSKESRPFDFIITLYAGTIYVMNDHGKTVAKYELDPVLKDTGCITRATELNARRAAPQGTL